MGSLAQAWRSLGRRPGYTISSIATLAFGIAVTSAAFSLVNGILLKPLPYPDADRLVTVMEASPTRQERVSLVAPARLADWQRGSRTFVAISGSYTENITDTSGDSPERLDGRRVMPGYFDVFATPPIAGRTFLPDEERYGGPAAVVISEGFWTRRFGRRVDAVGRRLTVAGRGYTIVGVMPASFAPGAVDAWVPAQLAPFILATRQARFLSGVGRLKAGVTLRQAREDMARVQRALGDAFPATDKDWSVEIGDLKESRVGRYRQVLALLAGAVVLLFVIAVANVGGLALVQVQRRAAELAIRGAIGATRPQIVAVILRETSIVAVIGAVLGALGGAVLLALARNALGGLPRVGDVRLDPGALVVVVFLTATALAACGLVPALLATRHRLAAVVALGGRGMVASAGGRHRLQSALVVSQISLSLVLAGSAALLVRSYGALARVNMGFDADDAVTFHVGAAWNEDRGPLGVLQQRFVERLQQLPGVRAAGYTNFLPATGATLRSQVRVAGIPGPDPGGTMTVGTRTITPGYLQALRVPLVGGEWCAAVRAGEAGERTVLVNRRFLDVFAQGANVVGRTLAFDQNAVSWRIVGVVGDVLEDGPAAPAAPYVYACMRAGSWPDPEYVVSGDRDVRATLAAVREIVHELAPDRPVFGVRRVSDVTGAALDQPRLNAAALAAFAAGALALAALGLYALLMLVAQERRREMGVRAALGASPADIVRLMVGAAARLVGAGVLIGAALLAVAGRIVQALLFGVSPHDPRALLTGALVLVGIAALAIAVPTRRAAMASAIEAMRAD